MKNEEKNVIVMEAEEVQGENPVIEETPVVDEYWSVKKPKFLCKIKKVKKEKEPKEKKGIGKKFLVGAGIAAGTVLIAKKVLTELAHNKDQVGDGTEDLDDLDGYDPELLEQYKLENKSENNMEDPVEEKTEE